MSSLDLEPLLRSSRYDAKDWVLDANTSTILFSPDETETSSEKHSYSTIQVPEYIAWVSEKQKSFIATCEGWPQYKEWIDALFRLAPPAPSCEVVRTFVTKYKNDPRNAPEMKLVGMLLLQRNVNKAREGRTFRKAYQINGNELKGRMRRFAYFWDKAMIDRRLPPNVEMLLYTNDKPRVLRDLGLPAFSISTEYPVGIGLPSQWKHHVPFPSHLYSHYWGSLKDKHDFDKKKPQVFFRGQYSENCWARFLDPTSKHCTTQPRFKLANATKNAADQDVIDIGLTGFALGNDTLHKLIWQTLKLNYNISKKQRTPGKLQLENYRYLLASPSNGWAGTTTMNALLLGGGSCMFFINDTTIDEEGMTRALGEIYFPLLKPDRDVVIVQDYDQIAKVAREWNADPAKAKQCGKNGHRFAKKFLGEACALDLVELLSWSYYRYVKTGCQEAFNHVVIE